MSVQDSLKFNPIYWAAQPPQVQALKDMDVDWGFPTQGQAGGRTALGISLANAGYTIDALIMIQGFDPFQTMNLRQQFGYTWVPSALQPNITVAPGVPGFGTLNAYDPLHPPGGSIKVSTDVADYKPFTPPVVVPPMQPSFVKQQIFQDQYAADPVAATFLKDGDPYLEARGKFIFHIVPSPVGPHFVAWFTLAPTAA